MTTMFGRFCDFCCGSCAPAAVDAIESTTSTMERSTIIRLLLARARAPYSLLATEYTQGAAGWFKQQMTRPIASIVGGRRGGRTTGPADDYFFCFATGPAMWREASFYAEGRDEFLRALGAKLGAPLEAGLCNSTDFASRVLWPPSLAGQPMFRFEATPPKDRLGKLFGLGEISQTYSERIAAVLAGDG